MGHFLLNVVHYARRALRDRLEVLLLIALPLGLTILNGVIFDDENVMAYGYNIAMSNIAPVFMLSFQFFAGGTMLQFLHKDLKGEMRNRLGTAPCSKLSFLAPAFFANWLFSILNGLILIVVTALFLNVYWGNLLILALVLMLVSLIAILIFALVFLFAKTYGTANGLIYIISFGMMFLSGWLLGPLLSGNPVGDFLMQYTPLSLGINAIINSGMMSEFVLAGEAQGIAQSWINIGILAGIAAVLGLIAAISARRVKI